MPSLEQRILYAQRAASARERARAATDPEFQMIFENMAASYEMLVEEADMIGQLQGRLAKG